MQVEKTDAPGVSAGGTFTMVDFAIPDQSIFNVPSGYAQFETEDELMRHQRRLLAK